MSQVQRSVSERTPDEVAVLVVDDDPEIRDMMTAILAKHGYSVAAAENGQQALDVLRTVRPQLILLDVCMPVMDGPEFRQAQRRDRSLLRIPTVVMTAANVEPQLDLAVDETLRKPIRVRELLRVARKHCSRARS
jgi:CheY-like chemotaxis protein